MLNGPVPYVCPSDDTMLDIRRYSYIKSCEWSKDVFVSRDVTSPTHGEDSSSISLPNISVPKTADRCLDSLTHQKKPSIKACARDVTPSTDLGHPTKNLG